MYILKKIKPLMDGVITTANRYDEVFTAGGLLDPKKSGGLKEYQTILFLSDNAEQRGLKPGQTVAINPYNYAKPIQKKNTLKSDIDEVYDSEMVFQFPMIEINGTECLSIRAGDLMFIVEEFEEVKEVKESNGKIQMPKMRVVK